jgi:hypothetical protein
MTLGEKPCPQILLALLIDRSNGPEVMPAPTAQLSTPSFTHCGTGARPNLATENSSIIYLPLIIKSRRQRYAHNTRELIEEKRVRQLTSATLWNYA